MFDKEDSRFHDLLNTVDSVSSELHRKGVGSQQKQSSVITREDENLWDKVILGSLTPQSLQHTIFIYVGLQFCLRGVQEQYDLTIA